MTLFGRIKELCRARNISVAKLEKELGFSNGYISQLNPDTAPFRRLQKIADYFEVSVPFLYGEADVETAYMVDSFGRRLLDSFSELNLDGKEEVIKYTRIIARMAEYQKGGTSSTSKIG